MELREREIGGPKVGRSRKEKKLCNKSQRKKKPFTTLRSKSNVSLQNLKMEPRGTEQGKIEGLNM
jgi:hypothetical protein